MSVVYLNGAFLPVEEATISPLDRGFLFGDGVYEVIPAYAGKTVGFKGHIDRLNDGLKALDIDFDTSHDYWSDVCRQLLEHNEGENLGIYLHLSRGADNKRSHAFPQGVEPTVFGMTFEIPEPQAPDRETYQGLKLHLAEDLRWRRCNIKSTSLLGNVLHFQQGAARGDDETILVNRSGELTEGAMSNVFVVKNGVVSTPVQDNQILPGVTRRMVLDILKAKSTLRVEERAISLDEVRNADEIWVTNSVDEIAAGISLDGSPVGGGKPGPVWEYAARLYAEYKFSY